MDAYKEYIRKAPIMKLFDYLPSGNGYKVRLLLSYLGLGYAYEGVDIVKGGAKTAQFLALNPAGQIPLLQLDNGSTLAQSNAILYYLAQGTVYWPHTQFEQAQALQWMFFEQYTHEPAIAVARYIRHYAMDTREAELSALTPKGYKALDVMETHLSAQDWFAGDQRSISDIAIYAYTHVAEEGGFDLSPYPKVRAWLARVQDHPRHIKITDVPA